MKARRTTYKGIEMRSRLEARFAASLDHTFNPNEHAWEYEPQCFGDETGQYLPDFCISSKNQPNIYVEVKPTTGYAEAARAQMETIWASEPDAELWTVYPVDACVYQHGSNAREWKIHCWAQPQHGAEAMVAKLRRNGEATDIETEWGVPGGDLVRAQLDGWHDGLLILMVPTPVERHLDAFRPELRDLSTCPDAQAAAAIKEANPDAWVMFAHTVGVNTPLIEVNKDAQVTDTYSGGHHFTMTSTDWIGERLSWHVWRW